jgi:hypothetical protein
MSRPISYSRYGIIPYRPRSLSDDMVNNSILHYVPGMINPSILPNTPVTSSETIELSVVVNEEISVPSLPEISCNNKEVQTEEYKLHVFCNVLRIMLGVLVIVGANIECIPLEYAVGSVFILFEFVCILVKRNKK